MPVWGRWSAVGPPHVGSGVARMGNGRHGRCDASSNTQTQTQTQTQKTNSGRGRDTRGEHEEGERAVAQRQEFSLLSLSLSLSLGVQPLNCHIEFCLQLCIRIRATTVWHVTVTERKTVCNATALGDSCFEEGLLSTQGQDLGSSSGAVWVQGFLH